MRKLVWCGAVVMVATAAAVYVAASHAAKHPDSYWGRCLAAAAYLGLHGNPFVALQPMAEQGMRTVDQTCEAMRHAAPAGAPACKISKPIKGAVPHEQADEHHAVELCEPIREVEADVPHSEPIRIEVFPGEPRTGSEPPPHGEVVLNEIDPRVFEAIVPPQTEEPTTGEEYDTEIIGAIPPMPPPDAEELPMPECAEECEAPCCWVWKMLRLAGLIHHACGLPEMLPMPCHDEETQEEMTEQPEAEVQPAYPHHSHRNSCPYMGCPYPYSRCTPATPVEPVEKPKKIKKKKPTAESTSSGCSQRTVCWGIGSPEGTCIKKKSVKKETRIKRLMCGGEDKPPHATGVDTMEFRPSDDHRDPPGTSPY
ncbi:MAG: hypothetical protein L0Z62_21195 [Gemmataceae bacterium]|nr:hypothetical protein [Gemmataceae bacterium]